MSSLRRGVALIVFAPFVAIVVRPLSAVLLSYELLPRCSRRCFFSPRRRSKPSVESSGYCSWKFEALREKLNKSFQEELKILKLDRDKMEKNEIEAALETSRKSLAANVLSSASQMELARKVFKDGRDVDLEGLKTCMTSGYSYIEGIEHLLLSLKQNNYEMHAFTNYPICVKGHTFQEPSCRFVFVSVEDGYLQSGYNQAVAIHDGKCE
nr:uncharacterized protein LOC112697629 isoform X8 [Arachis hypogaea]